MGTDDKPELRDIGEFEHIAGNGQMPDMDRVERSEVQSRFNHVLKVIKPVLLTMQL